MLLYIVTIWASYKCYPITSQPVQGRLTISNRYTHREIKLKFSALLKDYDLKYRENSKKKCY